MPSVPNGLGTAVDKMVKNRSHQGLQGIFPAQLWRYLQRLREAFNVVQFRV